ncbi:uncharacterized protein G2W53_007412 [Senna tora]|uniref:Uncharacterized protein n=1 Tax=Senna tora TaxID=362788 RepID=A0A834X6M4_9FABA|nr:uncharacterized protein G2W53_007412 [Senna tora]
MSTSSTTGDSTGITVPTPISTILPGTGHEEDDWTC